MYRALKTAQNEIHTALLKFSDDMVQVAESRESRQCDSSPVDPIPVVLQNAIQLLHAKQDVQFRVLNGALDTLNQNMSKIVTILMENNATITTSTVIPSIQPVGTSEELKNIGIVTKDEIDSPQHEADSANQEAEAAQHEAELAEAGELEVEESDIEADSAEHEVEESVEHEVEEAESAEHEEDEEEGIEVEEWTYKGRILFKDTENTVYMNDSGEIGDPIGTYDPVKNILKKLVV